MSGGATLPPETSSRPASQRPRPGSGRWVPDRLHVASFDREHGRRDHARHPITGGSAGDAICQGDSGGPILRERNGTAKPAGVSSLSWPGGCSGVTETRNGAAAACTDGLVGASRLAAGQHLASCDNLASATTLPMCAAGGVVVTAKAGNLLAGRRTRRATRAPPPGSAPTATSSVRSAADTATPWQPGTAAPSGWVVLQERGSLMVHNAQGASQRSNGSAVRKDFDDKGRPARLGRDTWGSSARTDVHAGRLRRRRPGAGAPPRPLVRSKGPPAGSSGPGDGRLSEIAFRGL
ncbi:trypsin-like serine protease [Streptomyces sp. NPDC054904]